MVLLEETNGFCSPDLVEPSGSFGRPWEALGDPGRLWEALGSSWGFWDALGCSGEVWGAPERFGRSGEPWKQPSIFIEYIYIYMCITYVSAWVAAVSALMAPGMARSHSF